MKVVIYALVLMGSFLFTPTVYCQQLTDREWDVYNDYVATDYFWSEDYYGTGYEAIYSEIADRYGISVDRVKWIIEEGLKRQPTNREWQIFYEVDPILVKTDDKGTYQGIANKYGLSLGELCALYDRCIYWEAQNSF